ncbi:hypothetical protein [Paramagnetospirillum kuznetsovii]|nr:hypothetical protein [Paramagnetospirillum kuznetsovii]
MDANLFQRMRQHIILNEGTSPASYRDSAGLLTAGYGFKVDNADTFAKLPFQVRDGQSGEMRPATEDEKRAEFDRINSLPQKQLDGEVKDGKAFILTKSDMDSKLASEIAAREAKIKTEVGAANWERLSDGQKTAVLDVHYANGSLAEFPKLKQAIKDGNAEVIGKNVDFHSKDDQERWTYNTKRLARNRAEAQGISEADAKRSVDADLKNGNLRPGYKPSDKTSDASDMDQNPSIGGLANEAEQTASADPRIAALRERAAAPILDPARSVLLKPVENWTEGEMKDVLRSAGEDFTGWKSGDPLKAHLYERVQDWHTTHYGDGEQQYDGGKPVEPRAIRPIPDESFAPVTPQGEDLWQASARMGDTLAKAAERDGYGKAVKGLQRGLNLLNDANPLPERSPAWGDYTKQPPLAEDGDYGPKTDFALKDVLSRHGAAKADDAMALGRFDIFAKEAKAKGSADGLDQATKDVFGPLYNGSDAPNGVLQATLNKLGGNGGPPLTEDNWIGPKTTESFAQVMDTTDPTDFTRSLGSNLGLL